MQVILTKDIETLGAMGKIVKVADGYARNYLIPRGMAQVANTSNKAKLEHDLRVLEKKRKAVLQEAKKLGAAIEKISVTVTKQVGTDEKIFGTVTSAELCELLAAEGLEISKKQITLAEEIKKVGVYTADVKLHPEVIAKFKVWVVSQ